MEMTKNLVLSGNTLATTVGANSLNVETIVSQPNNDQAELMVDGLDYVFDQAKFEEYVSSSSSKSSSSRKHRRVSSPRRKVRSVAKSDESHPIVTEVSPHNNTSANCKAGSSVHGGSITKKESSYKVSTTLTKRARQRQRQKMARQFARAMESTDGVHYYTNSHDQRRQETTASQSQTFSTPIKEEWVFVKRTHLTKKERAQKYRAHAARARAAIRKARESKSAKESIQSCKVWIPKSVQNTGQKLVEDSAFDLDTSNCLGQRTLDRDNKKCLRQSRDTSNCLGQEVSPSLRSSASPAVISTTKPENPSKLTTSMFNRLSPQPRNQGKAPVKERLGHTRRQTGDRV